MQLKNIYRPIQKELLEVEEVLKTCLGKTDYGSISEISRYLLDARGKRLRPALVLLSAKTSRRPAARNRQLINIACAVELIHMASLIHDDLIDHSCLRHHQPTINLKWGEDVSIALGDYLYSVAFELISDCQNPDITRCISSAAKEMCEGELIQVCERENLDLLKERYIVIVKKKTASLFAASCQAGALIVADGEFPARSLKEYGLNFGIAFQIIDDCLDLVGREELLGKATGADLRVGEFTLPILYLLDKADLKESKEIKKLLYSAREDRNSFNELRKRFAGSSAASRAESEAKFYTLKAKDQLKDIADSPLKRSMSDLADYIVARCR